MSFSHAKAFRNPRISRVEIGKDLIKLNLTDGRELGVPLAWFPSLLNATAKQRQNFRLLGGGIGIHWPQLDEDISLAGLLKGPHVR